MCQGLFFDESYGFYQGQVLIGPAKVFSNVQWLYGVKPVLSKKSKFRVVVEEVGDCLNTCSALYGTDVHRISCSLRREKGLAKEGTGVYTMAFICQSYM